MKAWWKPRNTEPPLRASYGRREGQEAGSADYRQTRKLGCWFALYVVIALVVSGLWAAFWILGNMMACAYAGGTCDTNWIGVGVLAAFPAAVFAVAGVVAALRTPDEVWVREWREERTNPGEAGQGPDVRGLEVD